MAKSIANNVYLLWFDMESRIMRVTRKEQSTASQMWILSRFRFPRLTIPDRAPPLDAADIKASWQGGLLTGLGVTNTYLQVPRQNCNFKEINASLSAKEKRHKEGSMGGECTLGCVLVLAPPLAAFWSWEAQVLSLIPCPALQTKRLAWTRGCSHLSPTKQNCIWYSNPATWEGTEEASSLQKGREGLGSWHPSAYLLPLRKEHRKQPQKPCDSKLKNLKQKKAKHKALVQVSGFQSFFFFY